MSSPGAGHERLPGSVAGTPRAWWASATRRERGQLVLATLLATLATLASTALLALSGYLLARASQAPPIFTLTAAIVGVRLFGLLRATARYAERLVGHDLALRRLGRMRVDVFSRLIDLVPDALGPRTSTAVLDGVVADVERLQDLPVRVLVPGGALAATAVLSIVAAALMVPAAGLVLAATLAVEALALAMLTARAAGPLAAAQAAARATLAAELVVVLDAAPELVAWGAADAQTRRVAEAGASVDRLTHRGAGVASAGGAVTLLASGAGAVAALAVAAAAAAAGTLDVTLVAAVVLLTLGAAESLGALSDVLVARREVAVAATRVVELVAAAPADERGGLRAAPDGAAIALRGARLQRDGRTLLHHVDLDIAPGERVALVGASGAGKSTLGEALVGFGVLEGGTARVGGVEFTAADGEALRHVVRWAPQDPHVFPTTLAANLRIAAPEADDAELEHALRAVGGGAWLAALRMGLKTQLGEQGESCSGGERQRVGLARALLCGGSLIVLDEPASHLPHEEALAALRAVLDADPRRGALLITHRAEEAGLVGRSVRLEAGRTRAAADDLVAM